jgi:uncharacterized membrane protein
MKAKNFFSKEQQTSIVLAIANAEKNTSGEIRVQVDDTCTGNVLDIAANHFKRLKMDKTELHNGVLFYISVDDRKFAIIGDKGIHQKVPENFWDSVRDAVLSHFKKEEFDIGLIKGIEMAGEKLGAFFPYQKNDSNELSNDISFNK